MFTLSKLGIVLVSPLGTCFVLALIGLAFLLARRRRTGGTFVAAGLLWLLAWSLPVPSFWLCSTLQRQIAQQPASTYRPADTIILLGGGMQGRRAGWIDRPEASAVADRVWFAAQLYKAGRAPWIVISAGSDPRNGEVEAKAMASLLEDLGVPAQALLLDMRSRDTWQNARASQRLMQEHDLHTALLVTSAVHMPRALATFRKRGIHVTPAPADFSAPPTGTWPQRWLPHADALNASGHAMKEYVGLWMYRLRGKA